MFPGAVMEKCRNKGVIYCTRLIRVWRNSLSHRNYLFDLQISATCFPTSHQGVSLHLTKFQQFCQTVKNPSVSLASQKSGNFHCSPFFRKVVNFIVLFCNHWNSWANILVRGWGKQDPIIFARTTISNKKSNGDKPHWHLAHLHPMRLHGIISHISVCGFFRLCYR